MTLAEVLRTAAEQFNPDDGIDLVGMLIVASPGIIAAIGTIILGVVTVRGQRRGRARQKQDSENIRVIRGEVKNDHPDNTNLRDDLDEVRELMKDMSDRQISYGYDIRGIRQDVGQLRGEIREDRGDLAKLERRVVDFTRREHPGANPL